MIVVVMMTGYVMHFTPKSWSMASVRVYTASPLLIQSLLLAIVLFIIIQTRRADLVPFVYLQY